MGSRIGDVRRRRSRRWRLAGRASTMRPRSTAARRHDQPGRRRLLRRSSTARRRSSVLPVHAVLRRLGRIDSDREAARSRSRAGRQARSRRRHRAASDRLSRSRRIHRGAAGGLDGRPEVRRPGRDGVSQRSAFTANVLGDAQATLQGDDAGPRTARSRQITFSNRPGGDGDHRASTGPRTRSASSSSRWATERRRTRASGRRGAAGAAGRHDRGRGAPVSASVPASAISAGRAGCATWSTPTLLDLKRLNLLDAHGQVLRDRRELRPDQGRARPVPPLAQHRQPERAGKPRGRRSRSGAVGLGPPSPCSRAWRSSTRRRPGRWRGPDDGQLIGLELAHTLGLTPPPARALRRRALAKHRRREPSVNRRYNVVQRAFIATDRSLMKPSATNPVGGQRQHAPRGAGLRVPALRLRRNPDPRVPDARPGHGERERARRRDAVLRDVRDDDGRDAGLVCPSANGAGPARGRASSSRTSPRPFPRQRRARRASTASFSDRRPCGILSNLGVPVSSGTRSTGRSARGTTHSGLFSFALPVPVDGDRIELWKGAPGGAGSLLLYAQDRTAAPVVSSMTVGEGSSSLARRAPGRDHLHVRAPRELSGDECERLGSGVGSGRRFSTRTRLPARTRSRSRKRGCTIAPTTAASGDHRGGDDRRYGVGASTTPVVTAQSGVSAGAGWRPRLREGSMPGEQLIKNLALVQLTEPESFQRGVRQRSSNRATSESRTDGSHRTGEYEATVSWSAPAPSASDNGARERHLWQHP